MKVKRVYNNNTVHAEDCHGVEYILLGRGLGFRKKPNDQIDPTMIEKTFILNEANMSSKYLELLKDIPPQKIELAHTIIEGAQKELNVTFNDSIYVALTDHIHYAITRYKNNEPLKNVLLWEIKKFYRKEFIAAQHAIKQIEKAENLTLLEDEAGFIALHFVNAQQEGEEMKETIMVTEVIEEILRIIKYFYCMDIDENSLNYSRFVTHIRYFIRRLFAQELSDSEDDFLYEQIKQKYPKSFECAIKVNHYISKKFDIIMTHEELVYFMLHINRVTQRQTNNN
ncbi:MAG: BglG family transcription antiterminator LicT [Turicibacter sp.]